MPTEEKRSSANPTAGLSSFRITSLALSLVLLTAAGILAFATLQRMTTSRQLALHSYLVRAKLKDLQTQLQETRAELEMFGLSGDQNHVSEAGHEAQQELRDVSELESLTANNPTQQKRLAEVRGDLQQESAELENCEHGTDCGSAPAKSVLAARLSQRMQRMEELVRNVEADEDQLLNVNLSGWQRLLNRMIIALGLTFALALLLLLYNIHLLLGKLDRGREQEEREKSNAESFRLLSARILELQDVERRKIARELHDSVGQFLAGMKLNLGRLQRREMDVRSPDYLLIAETMELTDRAILEVRTISHLLHPPLLDELGFHSAARWLAEGFSKRSGIEVDLQLQEVTERLPREVELAMFRVLQESLTNVHRHAKAKHVDVVLTYTPEVARLAIHDDGRGLTRETLQNFRAGQAGGIGLAGMRERLFELGGTLEVESNLSGTTIQAVLPMVESERRGEWPGNYSLSPIP